VALTVSATISSHAALTVPQALLNYDTLVGDYNLITFGDATLHGYGDTQGGLAVGGNLTIDGGAIATQSTFANGASYASPTLYVKGSLTVNGTVTLQNGYAATPGVPSTGWSWTGSSGNQLKQGSAVRLDEVNSPSAKANLDPRSASLNPNWNFTSLKTQFTDISTALGSAAVSGKISVVNQTLTLAPIVANQHGAIVFDLDMNLLVGNRYNGQTFSNIQFNVATGSDYIVNVFNGNGDTLFGTSSGINFNQGTGYNRLLWNIVDTPNTTSDTISFGNGGQFFGSILAPTYLVKNAAGTIINGQVVADTFAYSCNELHFTGFCDDLPPTPEPSTYGLLGAVCCVGVAGFSRWRKRRAADKTV
jgi:choice-of-anchor A domain-containing protein